MKVDNLFCSIVFCWNFPNQIISCNATNIFENLTMNKGALTWVEIFGVTMQRLLIIEPFFHWSFWKTKIENYIGIWGCY